MDQVTLNREEKEWVIGFFNMNKEKILNQWHTLSAENSKKDDFKVVQLNGETTFKLMKVYLGRENISLLRKTTRRIVENRLHTDISLPNLIKNISHGRQITLNQLSMANQHSKTKINASLLINQFFDMFIYETITHYIQMKDEIISKKNQFIKEMHNDRLTIVGKIAASFAHEFRNPLTSIKGFIYLLEKEITINSQAKNYFSIINQEMDSLEKKVTQFLYLSKMKGLDDNMEIFDLSVVIEDMIQLMYPRFLVDAIEVKSHTEVQLIVFGVREQIKQVILNILNNAVEELTETDNDRLIDIRSYIMGKNIIIEITNNGRMIPAHILENIFEPFISTKELGTGLGLSVCRQIIEKHNGFIEVESNQGKTTFKIILQRVVDQEK